MNDFIEENCMICGSHNYIRYHENLESWICWNCNSPWWIDERAKSFFMMKHGYDSESSDMCLLQYSPFIIFGNGQNEKDS